MFSKILSGTLSKVATKADSLRHTVVEHAQKARDLLTAASEPCSDAELEQQLLKQIAFIQTLDHLHVFCVQCIARVIFSESVDAPRYAASFPGGSSVPNSGLPGHSPVSDQGSGKTSANLSSKDPKDSLLAGLLSQTTDNVQPGVKRELPPREDGETKALGNAVPRSEMTREDSSSPFEETVVKPPNSVSPSALCSSDAIVQNGKVAPDDGDFEEALEPPSLTFRQVLLRSQGLETLLETICRLPLVQTALSKPTKAMQEDEVSTLGALLRLLSLLMIGDKQLLSSIIQMACTLHYHEENNPQLLAFKRLMSVLKLDWVSDGLLARKHALRQTLEILQSRSSRPDPESQSTFQTMKLMQDKIACLSELDALADRLTRRARVAHQARGVVLAQLIADVDAARDDLSAQQGAAMKRKDETASALGEASGAVAEKCEAAETALKALQEEIRCVETRKDDLMKQLSEVNKLLQGLYDQEQSLDHTRQLMLRHQDALQKTLQDRTTATARCGELNQILQSDLDQVKTLAQSVHPYVETCGEAGTPDDHTPRATYTFKRDKDLQEYLKLALASLNEEKTNLTASLETVHQLRREALARKNHPPLEIDENDTLQYFRVMEEVIDLETSQLKTHVRAYDTLMQSVITFLVQACPSLVKSLPLKSSQLHTLSVFSSPLILEPLVDATPAQTLLVSVLTAFQGVQTLVQSEDTLALLHNIDPA